MLQTEYSVRYDCLSELVTFVSPATAKPIEIAFGVADVVGPRNRVLSEGLDHPRGMDNF